MLGLEQIRIDGGTQVRAELNQDTVDAYAQAIRDGAEFPPVTVFFDGKTRWLADGFHRYFATKAAGKVTILENVIPGTKRDAILFSLGANGIHGLNRTNADKRSAVLTMLNDPEWSAWSDREIAKQCHVSNTFVSQTRGSLTVNVYSEKPTERTFTTKHGTTATMETANIGKPSESIEYKPQDEEYTELDAAHDQIHELQAALVVANIGSSDSEESTQAANLIAELRAEIKTLQATLKAVKTSRDGFQNQVAEMQKQINRQRRELDKLAGTRTA